MIRMTVQEMLDATGARLVVGDAGTEFRGLVIDSRIVGEGGAFVAFPGERVDGNRYVAQAIDAGASVAVVTAEPDDEALEAAARTGAAIARIPAEGGEDFMLALAGAWRERNPQWTVVGVTGSVGKTTTKEMLACGIGACVRTHATKGNFNNLLGVPLTMFAASAEDEVLVLEMGMNNAGELDRIATAARPDVAVITNVGTSHIGHLGSREGIARAKAEVVRHLRGCEGVPATLVLSAADDFSDFIERTFCEPCGVRVLRVGGDAGRVRLAECSYDDEGLPSVVLELGDGTTLAGMLSLPGRAAVLDALSAIGVVCALELPATTAFEAICHMPATHMRLEVSQGRGTARVIDDSYNASPASMASALDVLCSMRCAGRRVAVLGEMGELGDQATLLHSLVGAYAAAKPLDLLVLVGDELAGAMAESAATMGFSEDKTECFRTVGDAAAAIVPILGEDDLVLVKASRAAGLDAFAKEVLGS